MGLLDYFGAEAKAQRAAKKAKRQLAAEQISISDVLREYDSLSSTLLETMMDTEQLTGLHAAYFTARTEGNGIDERGALLGKLTEVYDANGWSMPDEQLVLAGETPGGKSTLTELYERAIEQRVETVEGNGQYGLAHLISAATIIRDSEHDHTNTVEGVPLNQRANTILTNLSLFLSRHKTNGNGGRNLGQTLSYLLDTRSDGQTLAEELSVVYEGDNPGEQLRHEATRAVINRTKIPAKAYAAAEMVIAGHTSRGLDQATTYIPPEDTTKQSPSVQTLVTAHQEITQRLGPYITALKRIGFDVEYLPVSDDVFTMPARHGVVCIAGMKEHKDHNGGDLVQTLNATKAATNCIKDQETRDGLRAEVQTLITEAAQERYREFTDSVVTMEEAIADETGEDSSVAALRIIDDRIRVGEIAFTYASAMTDKEAKGPIIKGASQHLITYQKSAIGILEKEVGTLQKTDNGPSLELTPKNPDRLVTLYSQLTRRYAAINDNKQTTRYAALTNARVLHAEEGRLQQIEDSTDGLTSTQCKRLSSVYTELGKQYVALGDRTTAESYLRDARSQADEADEIETAEHRTAHDATLQVEEPGQGIITHGTRLDTNEAYATFTVESAGIGFDAVGLGPDRDSAEDFDDGPTETE